MWGVICPVVHCVDGGDALQRSGCRQALAHNRLDWIHREGAQAIAKYPPEDAYLQLVAGAGPVCRWEYGVDFAGPYPHDARKATGQARHATFLPTPPVFGDDARKGFDDARVIDAEHGNDDIDLRRTHRADLRNAIASIPIFGESQIHACGRGPSKSSVLFYRDRTCIAI